MSRRKPRRHYNPERAIHKRTAAPQRKAARAEARARYSRQLRKGREVGIDPKHRHAPAREDRKAWLRRARKWEDDNPPEPIT